MSNRKTKLCLFLVGIISLVVINISAHADSVTFGLPPDSNTGNCIPFGCAMAAGSNGRYQQIYDAEQFSEAIVIGEIRFHITEFPLSESVLPVGKFALSFSTTKGDTLSTVFDSNVGLDSQAFSEVMLQGGPAGRVLSFTGQPFHYDPSDGNLLLDIQVSEYTHPCSVLSTPNFPPTCAFYDKKRSAAGAIVGRATDWITKRISQSGGLVTEFILVSEPVTCYMAILGLSIVLMRRRSICQTTGTK